MKTINTPIKSDTMWDHYITIKIILSYFLINNHTMWSYINVKTWCIQAPEEVANNARLSQFTEQKISVVLVLCWDAAIIFSNTETALHAVV